MAKQPMPPSRGGAGLSLLIVLSDSLVVVLAETGSWPMAVLLLGLVAVLAGVAELCVLVYRHSRAGDGILRSPGRTARAAVKLIVCLVP